jgi:hypothetical protein
MKKEEEIDESENLAGEQSEKPQEDASSEVEFKLTVRKLEMPIRPRGVLAE